MITVAYKQNLENFIEFLCFQNFLKELFGNCKADAHCYVVTMRTGSCPLSAGKVCFKLKGNLQDSVLRTMHVSVVGNTRKTKRIVSAQIQPGMCTEILWGGAKERFSAFCQGNSSDGSFYHGS